MAVRRPRVRGLAKRFKSRSLPLFLSSVAPTAYLRGLAEGDFDLALRGLLGARALPVASWSHV